MDTRGKRPSQGESAGFKKGDLYWKAIEPIWKQVSIYDGPDAFLNQFSRGSAPQALLLAAHWCQSEICNGGLNQFYANSTGVLAPESVKGLLEIRLDAAAKIVAKANSMLGDPYPRDRKARAVALKGIQRPGEKREAWDPFYKLDDKFYKSLEPEFSSVADAFVRENMELFFLD